MSPLARGLVNMELHRGDGSLGTFLGVQSGLAMKSIDLLGSKEQKQRWLPAMARLDAIGAFALTEPAHGSDSVALETIARRKPGGWVLDGAGVPDSARLPGANTFKDAGQVLVSTRSTCAWAALGHAVAAYDAALTYSKERVQFGKPLCSFQLVQERLVRMLSEITGMQLYCMQLARLEEAGQLTDTIAGLAKYNNTRKARTVIADARDMLGGNGVLLSNHVIRHMGDIEVIHTYEGTEAMQALIVGRDITGIGAFV
jgi:glutaryl-CoA dehydrogenase